MLKSKTNIRQVLHRAITEQLLELHSKSIVNSDMDFSNAFISARTSRAESSRLSAEMKDASR